LRKLPKNPLRVKNRKLSKIPAGENQKLQNANRTQKFLSSKRLALEEEFLPDEAAHRNNSNKFIVIALQLNNKLTVFSNVWTVNIRH
jgi:hypothetical protein